MPITIQHGLDPGLVGALEYLTAQAEERKRQQQQAALEAQRQQQLAAVAAPTAPAPPQRQAGGIPDFVANAWGMGGGGGGRSGGYGSGYAANDPERLAAGLLGKIIDSRGNVQRAGVQGQYDLEQARLNNEADFLLAEQNANADLAQEFATDDPEEWLRQGFDRGELRYSDAQKREMARLRQSINDARIDPTLTPGQRAAFIAQQEQMLFEIEGNPERVPFDERPKGMQQLFDEETFVHEGRRYVRGERNGMPDWKDITDNSAATAEIKRQELQQKAQHQQSQLEGRAFSDEMKLRTERGKSIQEFYRTILKLKADVAAKKMEAKELGEKVDTSDSEAIIKEMQAELERMKAEQTPGEAMKALLDAQGMMGVPTGGTPVAPAPAPPAATPAPAAPPQQPKPATVAQPQIDLPALQTEAKELAQKGRLRVGHYAMTTQGSVPVVKGDGDEEQYMGQVVVTEDGRVAVVEP